ncbi:MAG: polysaccharide deacetylase, partial [Lachnospiraceae bacterium]|nr:polysaccharide deacetylase [Lachnospiraceae bacterium]
LQRQINILTGNESELKTNKNVASDNEKSDVVYTDFTASGEENLANPEDTLKVYLTFDDGPSDHTDDILNILDDYGVKATFFVIGKEDEHSREMYTRIVNEGHTIGMHSYSHRYSDIYSSLDAFVSDLDRIQNLVYDVTGVDSMIYRFPGGSSNQVSNVEMQQYIRYLNDAGIKYFDWNVSSGDATSQAYSPDELVENVMRDVVKYKTSVVLMHDADTKDATVAALPNLIERLQAEGAILLPISDDTTLIQHVKVDPETSEEADDESD